METCSDDDGVDELAMYPFDKIARKTKKGRDTTQKSRAAVEEKRLAESAAKGITSVKYGIGEKAKTTRNTDFQERVDGMYEVMDEEESGMAGALKAATSSLATLANGGAGANVASPTTKAHKSVLEITALLNNLYQEFMIKQKADMSTEGVMFVITMYEKQRKALTSASYAQSSPTTHSLANDI